MRFVATIYVSIEAPSEEQARHIVESMEITGEDDEKVSWSVMARELEQTPEL